MKKTVQLLVLLSIFNLNVLTENPNLSDKTWMLDEHTRITLDAMQEWEYINSNINQTIKWNNNELKFIVLSSNLLTDMWDKGQFLTENLYDGMRLTEVFISMSNSVYKKKDCKKSVPDILRTSQDYTEYLNYYIEDTSTNFFNFYPDKKIRDDDGLSRTKGFHFDNLFSLKEIKERWNLINQWVKDKGKDKEFIDKKGIKRWFVLIGIILHAVQDFYCHSNWVLLAAYEGNNKNIDGRMLPIWEDIFDSDSVWIKNNSKFDTKRFLNKITFDTVLSKSEFVNDKLSGLQTGNCKNVLIDNENCSVCTCESFIIATQNGSIAPWVHRHPEDIKNDNNEERVKNINNLFDNNENAFINEYDAAILLSKRASVYWINKLLNVNMIGPHKLKKMLDTISTTNDIVSDSFTGCDVDLSKILEKFNRVYPQKY